MIDRYTIKMAPAVSHKDIMKNFDAGAGLTPDHTNQLTKVKAKVEIVGDLGKEVGKGKTPEEVVGHLAFKTPDMQATACAHHEKILGGDLYGHHIPLDGRIPRDFGKVVELDGKKGVYFEKTPEEDALERWYSHHFLDVERQIAKQWRRNLCGVNHEHSYSFFQKWFPLGKPKNLAQAQTLADAYIDGSSQETALKFGLDLLAIPLPPIAENLD